MKILRDGFRNATGRYLTNREWSGVWVSDRPLDNNEGASGEALLQITIAEDLLAAFEWVEEGKPYREWLVPAAVLNDAGTVRLLTSPPINAPRTNSCQKITRRTIIGNATPIRKTNGPQGGVLIIALIVVASVFAAGV